MRRRSGLAYVAVAGLLVSCAGCMGVKSYYQRKHRPHYTITKEFYQHPPKSIAVLPVTPRYEDVRREKSNEAAAAAVRAAEYRHLSPKPYQDIEMEAIDAKLCACGLLENKTKPAQGTLLDRVSGPLVPGDPTNLTRLVNPLFYVKKLGGSAKEAFGEKRFEAESVKNLHHIIPADAYLFGTCKEHGWVYAVLFSWVSTGAEVRMYDASTGRVLWKSRGSKTSFAWVVGSPYMVPIKFVTTYLNAGAFRLDSATDDLFRRIMRKLPVLRGPVEVKVRAVRKAPVFKKRGYSYWFWADYGKVPKGRLMTYLVERDGWYKVRTTVDGKPVTGWVFGGQAEVVDAKNPARVIRPVLTGDEIFYH